MANEAQWYVAVDGKQEGPIAAAEVVARVRAGRLDRNAHVFGGGMKAWAPITSVPELAAGFATALPPTPPTGGATGGAHEIVVAAGSDENDGRWRSEPGEFGHLIESTLGECVDIFAPAARVASAFFPLDPGPYDPNEIVCQLSGTSMAAPHVSGVAAMILHDYPDLTAEQLRTMILNWAERGVLESNPADPNYIGDGSPNLLLHWDPSNLLRDGFETGDLRLWSVSP